MNKVENGILNNVESFLNRLKNCVKPDGAKLIVNQMIDGFNVSDKRKLKFKNDLNKKRSLAEIITFAYNMNLSAEGLKVR